MPNVILYASIFQAELDKIILPQLTSARMELGASRVRYTGGAEVKIPKISMDGLGDYSRTAGFPTSGAVALSWETHTFEKDRAQQFAIDRHDVDETNFALTAGNIMGEFQRTKVVPEIDAYRYSKIFTFANTGEKTSRYALAAATIFTQLKGNIKDVQKVIGESEPLVVYISYDAANYLDSSTEISRQLSLLDLTVGGITTKVKGIDTIPLIRVPAASFKSAYTFNSGSSAFGFTPTSVAMDINWIICADSAVIAITKQDTVGVFPPGSQASFDGWIMNYRRYHTLMCLENKLDGVFVSYTGIAAPALTATVAAGAAAGTKFTATAGTGNTLAYILGTASPAVKYNDLIASYATAVEPYTSAADIATAVATNILTMMKVNAAGRIIEVKEVTLASGDIHA
jgi:hypothetical protein